MIKQLTTNRERALEMRLKEAPTIKGYTWSKLQVEEVLKHNREFEEGKQKLPRILAMFLDVPPSCDLACWFCYASKIVLKEGEKPIQGMTIEEYLSCVDSAKLFGAETISIAGRGEPFLYPDVLMSLAREVTKKEMWLVVFTNNMNITPELAKELYGLNVSVIAKLGSLDPDAQDWVVGRKGAHKAIYAGLDNLLSAGFTAPRLGVDATIYRDTVDDLVEVFRYCREHNIIPYFEALIERGDATRNRNLLNRKRLTNQELVEFFERIRGIDEMAFGYTWVITPGMHSLAYEDCKKNRTTLSIRENGDVGTCVNDRDTRLGNIREATLQEIVVNSEVLKRIRAFGAECCSSVCGISR